MAKTKIEKEQLDMFSAAAQIDNLGATKVLIKGDEVQATLIATTNANDVAQLSQQAWRMAVAEWLLKLCDYDMESTYETLRAADHNLIVNQEPMDNHPTH
jgi:hypothetical protein